MGYYHKGWFITRLICILATLLTTFSPAAYADTDGVDLTVGMKTIPLLNNKLTGTVELAVIFNPSNPDSLREAAKIKAILDGNFQALGDLKVNGVLIPVTELDKLRESKIAVLTGGLSPYYNAISNAVSGAGVLTMSTDLECVRAQKCVLGIQPKPSVEIYYSKIAATNANVAFGQVFSLLVTEI